MNFNTFFSVSLVVGICSITLSIVNVGLYCYCHSRNFVLWKKRMKSLMMIRFCLNSLLMMFMGLLLLPAKPLDENYVSLLWIYMIFVFSYSINVIALKFILEG